jgi:hypothetical protein
VIAQDGQSDFVRRSSQAKAEACPPSCNSLDDGWWAHRCAARPYPANVTSAINHEMTSLQQKVKIKLN